MTDHTGRGVATTALAEQEVVEDSVGLQREVRGLRRGAGGGGEDESLRQKSSDEGTMMGGRGEMVLPPRTQADSLRQVRGGDDLYPVALLKIVMAMKRLDSNDTLHFETLLDKVLEDMVVDRDDFARYVQRNMARLVTAAKKGDY